MADVDVFMEKAEESLASAGSDYETKRYNSSARGSYYAAYQAGVAALMNENITPVGQWTHRFVQARFAGVLVRERRLYRSGAEQALIENQLIRARADYTTRHISERTANRSLERARHLVAAVKERADGNR